MSGIGIPQLMMPEYETDPKDIKSAKPIMTRIRNLKNAVLKNKILGAVHSHCGDSLDIFTNCSGGFMYEPDSILKMFRPIF
eukprot:UN26169